MTPARAAALEAAAAPRRAPRFGRWCSAHDATIRAELEAARRAADTLTARPPTPGRLEAAERLRDRANALTAELIRS